MRVALLFPMRRNKNIGELEPARQAPLPFCLCAHSEHERFITQYLAPEAPQASEDIVALLIGRLKSTLVKMKVTCCG